MVACAICAATGVYAQTPVKVGIEKSVLVTETKDVTDDAGEVTGQKEVATSCNAEVVLSDNECFTATTVYASAAGTNDYTYKDGLMFTDWIELRVKDVPSEANPTGTADGNRTPVVIVAKKNATFNAYVRTGNNKTCNLFDQSTFTALEGTSDSEADEGSSNNNFWIWTWTIEAGKTYVLTEKGGTGRLSGFSYILSDDNNGGETAINGVNAGQAASNAPVYSLGGQKVGAAAKGIVVKNGKKFLQK